MNRMLYRSMIVLMLLGAILAVFARPVMADAPVPDKQTAKYEIKFMENVIDHHAMAVMMAEMCLMKAIHPELESMSQEIIATQSAEIEMMQTWLMDWYGTNYVPDIHMGEMECHMSMDAAQFEGWFLKRMISHHAKAIQEIEVMQTWLCEWHGVCEYRQNL